MENRKSDLLILIPAYNEEKNLPHVLEDLKTDCPQYDCLVINDGSTDGTAQVCRFYGVSVLDLPVNLGLTGAIQAGMKYAVREGYSYALQFDADGQHCAEYVSNMLECIQKENCNIVIASRYVNQKKGWSSRELGSRLISSCIFMATGQKLKDPTSGMRMYDITVMEKIARYINFSPEPDTLAFLIKGGATVKEVPAFMNERIYGASYLTLSNSIKYMFYVCFSILVVNRFW